MTEDTLTELERLAQKADDDGSLSQAEFEKAWDAFKDKCSPDVILRLIAELRYLRSQNAILRDTCDIQRNAISTLERQLCEARAQQRTLGAIEVCPKWYALGHCMVHAGNWAECCRHDCPLRSPSPASTQTQEGSDNAVER